MPISSAASFLTPRAFSNARRIVSRSTHSMFCRSFNDGRPVACGAVVETKIAEMPRTLSNPIRLSFAEQRTAHPAPALGQHSEEILHEAGLSAREVADLKASGAVK